MVDIVIFGATQRCGSTLVQRVFNQNLGTMIWGENGRVLTMLSRAAKMAATFSEDSPVSDEEYMYGKRPDDVFIANLNPPPDVVANAFVEAVRTLFGTMYDRRGIQRVGFKEVSHGRPELSLLRKSFPDCQTIFLARDPYDTWESIRLFIPQKSLQSFIDEWIYHVPIYGQQENFFWYHEIISNIEQQQRLCDLANISLDQLKDSLGRKVGSSHSGRKAFDAKGNLTDDFAKITAAIAPLRQQFPNLAGPISRFMEQRSEVAPFASPPEREKNHITYELFGIDPEAFYSEKFTRGRVDFSSYPEAARMQMPFLRFEYLAAEIRRHFGDASDIRVLDIGCGSGRFGSYLREEFPDVHLVGIDLSPNCEEDVRFHGYHEFFVASADFALPLADESVDAVFSMDLFGHIEFRNKDKVIAEIHRVLRNGGTAIHGIETGKIDYLNADPADLTDPVRKYVWIDGHIGVETVSETLDRFRQYFTVDKCLPWVFPLVGSAAALSTNVFGERYKRIIENTDREVAKLVMDATLRGVYDYITSLFMAHTGAAVFEDIFISDGDRTVKLPHGAFTLVTLKKV